MRKTWFMLLALLLVAVPFAYAQDATPEAVEPWVCPSGFEGQTLSVFNWSTYVADDTIDNFEAACGVTVEYQVYGSNEDLLAVIRRGNSTYDIAVPSDYAVAAMIAEGLVQPIDVANIPNFANVSEELVNPPYDPGNQYSVPYQWGTVGVGYNVEAVGEPITSWEQVWSHDGPVAWIDGPREMLGVALIMLGFDPNSTSLDEIAQARDYLIANGDNVVYIAPDDGQAALERGDVDIAVEFSGDIFQVMAENEGFNYAIPEEGANVWVDNLVLLEGAPNPALAQVFMDYILHPQVSADISNYTAYATPNQTAINAGLINAEFIENTGIYPTQDVRQRLFFVADLPEVEFDYSDAWDQVKVALGQ